MRFILFFTLQIWILLAQLSGCWNHEIWVESEDLIPTDSLSTTVRWGSVKNCRLGSFVTGYETHVNQDGLERLSLICSELDSNDNFRRTTIIMSGTPSNPSQIIEGNHYAVSFVHQQWVEDGETYSGQWEMRFNGQNQLKPCPRNSTDRLTFERARCPPNWAICGFQAEQSGPTPTHNNTISRLRFKCCYYCVPEEIELVVRDVTNDGSTDLTTSLRKTIGVNDNRESSKTDQSTLSEDEAKEESESNTRDSSSRLSNTQQNTFSKGRNDVSTAGAGIGYSSNKNFDYSTNINKGLSSSRNSGSSRTRNSGSNNIMSQGSSHGSNSEFNSGRTRGTLNSYNKGSHKTNSQSVGKSKTRGTWSSDGSSWGVNGGISVPIKAVAVNVGGDYRSNSQQGRNEEEGSTSTHDDSSGTSLNFNSEYRDETQINARSGIDSRNEYGRQNTHSSNSEINVNELEQTGIQQSRDERIQEGGYDGLTRIFNREHQRHSQEGTTEMVDSRTEDATHRSIQAMFAGKYGSSISSGFNWGNTESSSWTHSSEETTQFTCEPKSRCILKQLVGKCGSIEFYTPKLILSSSHITSGHHVIVHGQIQAQTTGSDSDSNYHHLMTQNELEDSVVRGQEEVETQESASGEDEIWIIIQISTNHTGQHWEEKELCPLGSFVMGEEQRRDNEDRLISLSLLCSRKINGTYNDDLGLIQSGHIESEDNILAQTYETPGTGFSFIKYIRGDGIVQHGFYQVRSQGHVPNITLPDGAEDYHIESVNCPPLHALCGIRTVLDESGKCFITKLGLRCCYTCEVQERMIILHSFRNDGESSTTQSVKIQTGRRGPHSYHNRKELEDMVNPESLRIMFTSRFGNQSELVKEFNWNETPESLWEFNPPQNGDNAGHDEINFNYDCKSKHYCSISQLVGVCGRLEIKTPHVVVLSSPLPLVRVDRF